MTEENTSTRSVRLRRAAAAAVGVSAVVAGASWATEPAVAGETITYHYQVDVGGVSITCGTTSVTAVPGSVLDAVFHENADNRGEYHVTGTATPQSVALVDASGDTYNLRGASWYGGTFTDPDGNNPVVLTSTDEFTITSADGGPLGRVSAVVHLSPNGNFFSLDLGNCIDSNGP